MAHQTIDIIILAMVFIVVVFFWVTLGHMVYLAYCRNSCGQNRSGCNLDTTEAMFYVTKEASETSESHQEGHTAFIVSLRNDQYSV